MLGQGLFPSSFAIVIEWENACLSKLDRTRRMLQELFRQLELLPTELQRLSEVLILFDPAIVDQGLIQSVLDQAVRAKHPLVAVRTVPVRELHYYELKNAGVKLTHQEIVIFLDSDVIPEEGWLPGLLEAFARPGVDVVGGNTYVSLESLYSKAMALFWFFPLRQPGEGLIPASHFFANNVAFRRAVIESHPFPTLPQFRGQCQDLAKTLKREGVGLFLQQKSKVEHPPPNGLKHFISRALCDGHDTVLQLRRTGEIKTLGLLGAWERFLRSNREAYWVIRKRYRDVHLSNSGAGAAMAVAATYFGLALAGEIVSRVFPNLIRRHFAV